ncbi:hypothetical protein [Azospirillum endophyticum]
MPYILRDHPLPSGRRLVIVLTACSGWGRPAVLSLVLTDGTPYRHRNGRGVLKTYYRDVVDRRYQEPRSRYRACVSLAHRALDGLVGLSPRP